MAKEIQMKKTIFYVLVLSVGLIAGYYLAVIQGQQQPIVANKREMQFQIRTEEYQPSCAELENKKRLSVTTKGSDYFFVVTRKNDFIVFGLNTEGNTPPMTFWWSAELKDALEQACNL